VRLARFEQKRVAGFDGRRPALVANQPAAGDHMVELPLRAVRMKRERDRVGSDARDLHVERMPLVQIHRIALAPERFGDLLPGA